MTALNEYQRLESTGLWSPAPGAQRRDVIVALGDATLTITDSRDMALAHWSLPALSRANPGEFPAVYFPDGDPGETLELPENEAEFVAAIEKLRTAIERRRPRPGSLRLTLLLLSIAAVVALCVFWVPDAVRNHAVRVVPDVKRQEIGADLLARLRKVTGPACDAGDGDIALSRLSERLRTRQGKVKLVVVRNGVRGALQLLGGTVLLQRSLIEDFEEPDVVAGFVINEIMRRSANDQLDSLLRHAGTWATFRLLTTGKLDDLSLQSYAEYLLTGPRQQVPTETLLAGFKAFQVRSTPYAYAVDISGESTLDLIEADPFAGAPPAPVLSDADWQRLQGICGG